MSPVSQFEITLIETNRCKIKIPVHLYIHRWAAFYLNNFLLQALNDRAPKMLATPFVLAVAASMLISPTVTKRLELILSLQLIF